MHLRFFLPASALATILLLTACGEDDQSALVAADMADLFDTAWECATDTSAPRCQEASARIYANCTAIRLPGNEAWQSASGEVLKRAHSDTFRAFCNRWDLVVETPQLRGRIALMELADDVRTLY